MKITASLVKELREKTGAGMMDCKKALEACDGDIEKSFDWLREKGIAKAAKKADRIAAEGLTAFVVEGDVAAIVEVNTIAKAVVDNQPADLEAALAVNVDGKDLATVIAEASGKIGEKISLRRFQVLTKNADEEFGAYSHMGGKMTSVVKVANTTAEKARDVAMHVAASNPTYIDRTAIPQEVLDHELSVLKAQALAENEQAAKPKPENIVEKMVQGRLNKNLKEMCLVDQEFIKNPDETVGKYLGEGKVLEMVRFQVGEGMQKREENFAEEVAAQMKA